MVLLIVVGVVGASLHIKHDLTAGGVVVLERFLRGAPVLAPLLFTTMGIIGLTALLPEKQQEGGVLQESGWRTAVEEERSRDAKGMPPHAWPLSGEEKER